MCAERVGKRSKPVGRRTAMRLLELPDEVLAAGRSAGDVVRGPRPRARAGCAGRGLSAGGLLAPHGGDAAAWSVRAAELSARRAGARTKARRRGAALDPALAERARMALEQLTGAAARVGRDRLEIAVTDETELGEIVEALERACAAMAAQQDG